MTVWFEKKLGLGRLGDGEDMLHDVMVASLHKGLTVIYRCVGHSGR